MKKVIVICLVLIGIMGALNTASANDRWFSQEQIMNAVFDQATGSLIIRSTGTAPVIVALNMYEGQVSTATRGVVTSTGTIFNALGDVMYVDYYIKGGTGVDSQISNSKVSGNLNIPAGTAKDATYTGNPLEAPVIILEVLTPGASLYYDIIYQKPE